MVQKCREHTAGILWAELSPGLSEAVDRILHDPVPEALTRRCLETARRQVTRYPRRPRSGLFAWAGPLIAVSIAWIALATGVWGLPANHSRSARLPAPREDLAAAFNDDLPTAWSYAKAIRRSPNAIEALLDPQSRRSTLVNPRSLAGASDSSFSFLPTFTTP